MLGLILAAQILIPQHYGLVNDTAHVLTPHTAQALEGRLRSFEQQTTIEFAVLTVPDLQGETVEQFAEQVFKAWGIGKKDAENGLLFVIAIQDRKMRFEVGYGLESSLPDGRAGQILRSDQVRPYLQRNDWNGGISGAVNSAIAYLQNPVVPQPAFTQTPIHIPWLLIVFVIFVAICFIAWMVIILRGKDQMSASRDAPPDPDPYVPSSPSSYMPIFVGRSEPSESHRSSSSDDDHSSPSSPSTSSDSGGGFDFGGGSSGGGGASGDF